MTDKIPLIEDVAWTDLNCFQFNVFPDELLVMTNAERKDFDKAIDIFSKAGEDGTNPMNFETALHSLGFAACACSKPVEMETITL